MKKLGTRQRLVNLANALAKADGWVPAEGLDYETTENPRARSYWNRAIEAYRACYGRTPSLRRKAKT